MTTTSTQIHTGIHTGIHTEVHAEVRADGTELLTAKGVWEARVDDLAAVRRTLASAPAGHLGGRVGPVAAAVLEGWAARAGVLADAAQAHGDALWTTWRHLDAADEGAAAYFLGPGGVS
ncbi:hypothetical protein [Nocardioides sp.]|uniref:hypothetical protein n=1 Tax=Nocardioides sp. TaxID=35761 RepID=UPI0027286E99|nr:hypothetical protein [Nocardioides sp.]MDO9456371.1 hypothetical protein [Nocardioides sp.]